MSDLTIKTNKFSELVAKAAKATGRNELDCINLMKFGGVFIKGERVTMSKEAYLWFRGTWPDLLEDAVFEVKKTPEREYR